MILPQFHGDTADDIWCQAAEALGANQSHSKQSSRLGLTRELLHCTLHLRDPRQRWVLSRQPALNPAFAIAEVIWILQGRNDAAFPNYWNPILPKFSGDEETYHGAYGHRLREHLGIDQLSRAHQALLSNKESRQVVLQIWDSRIDLPNPDGSARSRDVPCNVMSMLKVRDDRLVWTQIMRSNDLYRGTPHNFVQFTTLQEVLSGWLELEIGSYIHISDSLHLYEHDMNEFKILELAPRATNTDNLALPKSEFEKALAAIGTIMDALRSPALTNRDFAKLISETTVHRGWKHLLYIAAADAARRRGWFKEMEAVAGDCANPALQEAWKAWLARQMDPSYKRGE